MKMLSNLDKYRHKPINCPTRNPMKKTNYGKKTARKRCQAVNTEIRLGVMLLAMSHILNLLMNSRVDFSEIIDQSVTEFETSNKHQ